MEVEISGSSGSKNAAPVDTDRLAGDVEACAREEEGHGGRDVALGVAVTAERVIGAHRVERGHFPAGRAVSAGRGDPVGAGAICGARST